MTAWNPNAGILALGSMTSAGGGTGNVKGCAIQRSGAGIYVVALDQPLNSADGGMITTVSNGPSFATFVHTSDVVKTVTVFSQAGAAQDASFIQFMVYRATP